MFNFWSLISVLGEIQSIYIFIFMIVWAWVKIIAAWRTESFIQSIYDESRTLLFKQCLLSVELLVEAVLRLFEVFEAHLLDDLLAVFFSIICNLLSKLEKPCFIVCVIVCILVCIELIALNNFWFISCDSSLESFTAFVLISIISIIDLIPLDISVIALDIPVIAPVKSWSEFWLWN